MSTVFMVSSRTMADEGARRRFDFGQAADDSWNMTDDMEAVPDEPVPDLIIPGAMLPVVALLIIGIIFYGIKKMVDYTSQGRKDNEVRFEVNLPEELKSEYEEIKAQYEMGNATLKDVKAILQKRAYADLTCVYKLQNEAKSLRQAEIMGKLPNSLRDDFVAARSLCEQEIQIVKAEAEDLEPGYGESIMKWASLAIQSNNMRKQKKIKEHLESEMTNGMKQINEASKRDPSLAKLTEEQKRQRVAQQIKIKQFIQALQSRGLSQSQIEAELRRNNIRVVKAPDSPGGGTVPSNVKKAE